VNERKEVVTDKTEMASLLNNYFCSVFTRESGEIPEAEKLRVGRELSDIEISQRDVARKIEHLEEGKAPGPDNITTSLLKKLKDELVYPLSKLFQDSLDTGQVPSEWKTAKVIPIFKKGTRGDPGNYRPVSLTSAVCKLMESILRDNIVDHLIINHLIKDSQHGFTTGRSCQTNLLEFLDQVTKYLDSGEAVDIVYLDFSKAFDKVPHKGLDKKLEAHGISGRVRAWIQEWLKDRNQWVEVNGARSLLAIVLSGVPQGSILGPILFIIYINNIDDMAKKADILNKFADDTKAGSKVSTPEGVQNLQDCLNGFVEWSKR